MNPTVADFEPLDPPDYFQEPPKPAPTQDEVIGELEQLLDGARTERDLYRRHVEALQAENAELRAQLAKSHS